MAQLLLLLQDARDLHLVHEQLLTRRYLDLTRLDGSDELLRPRREREPLGERALDYTGELVAINKAVEQVKHQLLLLLAVLGDSVLHDLAVQQDFQLLQRLKRDVPIFTYIL